MVMGKSLSYRLLQQGESVLFWFDWTIKNCFADSNSCYNSDLRLYAEEHARNIMQKQIFLHTDATIEHHIHMFTSDKGSFIP